ncbi:MAG: T9SS type A sorting domain-containing protein [Paludibacteraceae bacterium]|nr:T9SS type A sorting domain-containing protein [Paludibacteraceae bacterium]
MKKTNLFFRSLLTLVCLVASSFLALADTTVNSIAEIKKLDDGAKFTFKGNAMTTLHFYRYNSPIPGIFVQDDNKDVIFLAHANFMPTATWFDDPSYNGYKMHQGGTIVTSFSGTFKKASGNNPDRVTFSDSDLEKVESGSYGNPIPYTEVTLEDIVADPAKYAYQVVKLTADVTKTGTGLYATTYSFNTDAASLPIHLSAQLDGRSFPAGGTFYGMCDKYGSGYQFLIFDRYHIEPTKFFNLVDLYNFVDSKNSAAISNVELEILEPALVNFVARMPMTSNYYIQATANGQTSALCVSATSRGNTFAAQVGDSIKGLKGYYSKLTLEDGLYKGSMFRIKEENFGMVTVINSNNPISWQEQKVYNILQTPEMFESRLISLPVGEFKNVTFIENGAEIERVAFVQFDGDLRKQYDTIRVQMAGGGDMTSFVGIKAAIMGVYDLSEAIAAGYPTIILRDENDIIGNKSFASIGEMIAAGQPLSTKVTYEITNPVLVTYKYFAANTQGDNEHMCGLYVQDATGAILYKTGQPVEHVNPGDSISGIKGAFQYERNVPGHQEHYIKGEAANAITVLNSGNPLKPLQVTLDKIVDDPMAYAARLVKIDNLEITTKFGFSQGYPYETRFIYQNGSTMNVVWDNLYESMTAIGVVEYGIMGYGLTIFPIEVKDTEQAFNGTCRRIKDIKKLASGTEFTYVGNATTTFTDYENGILIQDYTGGILLKNAKLGDNGDAKVKTGMMISNIKGTYQPTNGDVMASIEITDADIEKIKIQSDDCGFTCRSTDINVVKHFYDKYLVGESLMLRGADIRESNGSYVIVFAYNDGVNDVEVKVPAVAKGTIDFSKKLVVGYARKFNGVLTFVMVSDEEPEYTEPELPNTPDPGVDVENVYAQHAIYISAEGQLFAPEALTVSLYDVNGRLVVANESSVLNLTSCNRGVYLVRSTYADGSVQITKVVR